MADLFVMAIAITTFVGSPMAALVYIGVSSYKDERRKIASGKKSDYKPSLLLKPTKKTKVSLRRYRTRISDTHTHESKKAG